MTVLHHALIFFGLYIAALLYISWRSKPDAEGHGYIMGNRSLGLFDIIGTMISYYRMGSAVIFWFIFVQLMGFGALWVMVPFYSMMVVMALCAPYVHRIGLEKNYLTMNDMIRDRMGPTAEHWSNAYSIYIALVAIASQLFITGVIMGGLFGIGHAMGVFAGVAVVLVYVVIGGFLSVVRTDVFQAVIMVVIAIGALLFIEWPERDIIITQMGNPKWDFLLPFSLLLFVVPAHMDIWQRYFACKNGRVARNGSLLALPIDAINVLGMVLFFTYLGGMAATGIDAQQIFIDLFYGRTDETNALVIALFGVFVMSAMLSTVDNQVLFCGSVILKNIMGIDPEYDRKRFVRNLRILTPVILLSLAALSLTIENLFRWFVDSYGFIGTLTPLVFYTLIKANGDTRFTAWIISTGLTITVVTYWTLFIMGYFANTYWFALPYGLAILTCATDWTAHRLIKSQSTR